MRRFMLIVLGLLALPGVALALEQSQIPPKFPIPFGNNAGSSYIRSIPTPSQIGIQNCAASLTDAFPPLTFVPATAGGCPPFGQDFNGILKQITQWSQWQAAGAPIFYDSGFSASISGYPRWAVLSNASTPGCFWVSTVDNNASDPDTGGANWLNSCAVGGSLVGSLPNPTLSAPGATPGTYLRPKITVTGEGRLSFAASGAYPTFTTLTSGSGTYTPPSGATRLYIKLVGGGGGGGGCGAGSGLGTLGGTTSFGGTIVGGGVGAGNTINAIGSSGGPGGILTSAGTGTLVESSQGGSGSFGQSGNSSTAGITLGGQGGGTIYGSGGPPIQNNVGGNSAVVGGGGAGGSENDTASIGSAGGGGGGGYAFIFIDNPASSYSYAVGAGGAGGVGGFSCRGGGNGLAGIIVIEEEYD